MLRAVRPAWSWLLAVCCVALASVLVASCGGDADAPPVGTSDAGVRADSGDRGDGGVVEMDAQARDAGRTPRDAAIDAGPLPEDGGPAGMPAPRVVHWQINSDWPEDTGSYFTPPNVFRRAMEYPLPPDMFAVQECGRACACGIARNYDPDTATCIDEPPPDSLPGELERITRTDFDYLVSAWATSVYWRADRFSAAGWFQWNWTDADPSYTVCPRPSDPGGNQQMNIAVHLRDNRDTADRADDRFVVLASMHVGDAPACMTRLLRYFDDEVTSRWPDTAFVLVSGDLNTRVDSTSATEAQRRAEIDPSCWYRQLVRHYAGGSACGPDYGEYFDAVFIGHDAGAPYADTKPICAEYTFINPGDYHSTNDLRCDSTRDFSRIDYTFVRGTSAGADAVQGDTDKGYFDANGNGDVDYGEKYAGHRAIRTVVRY